ncbi:MAG: hypothetical protein ACI81R_000875 [Bradymonadia bacterium]|jgi:hypothetical protein
MTFSACGGTSANTTTLATYATGGTVCVMAPDGLPLIENVDRLTRVRHEGNFEVLLAEAEEHWAQRSEKEHVEAAIVAWETAIASPTPGQDRNEALAEVFTRLAQGYYWLAHAHVRYQADNDAEMLHLYETGMSCAGNAIALGNSSWNREMLYERPIPESVGLLDDSDAPAVYWYATNLGRWGLLRGIATVISRVSDIYAMMNRVEETSPTYFYGATNRYFGVYYTKLPFGNPDVDQAERRLLANIEAHPEYLESRVLYGFDWGSVTQSRDIAEAQLQFVIDADISQWPDLLPENANAQRRAAQLLADFDEVFR